MLQVIVKDFQSIEEARLKVDGVTLIVGESNQGKSACLRALQAACTNRFKAGQVRHGQDQAVIKIKTADSDDVLAIARSWAGGSPMMKLGSKTFSKLGRTLPKEVNDFLNLGFIDLNGEQYSCNFHPQFQKPMLLEHSQQKVMEILSASSSLDDLKEAKECVLAARAKNKGAITAVEGIINETNNKLHEMKSKMEFFEPLYSQYSVAFVNYQSIEEQLRCASQLEELLNHQVNLTNEESVIVEFINEYAEYSELIETIDKINKLEGSLDSCDKLSSKEQILSKISSIYDDDLDKMVYAVQLFSELLETIDIIDKQVESLEKHMALLSEILNVEDTIKSYNIKRSDLEQLGAHLNSFRIVTSSEANLSKVVDDHECPICGNKVNQNNNE